MQEKLLSLGNRLLMEYLLRPRLCLWEVQVSAAAAEEGGDRMTADVSHRIGTCGGGGGGAK